MRLKLPILFAILIFLLCFGNTVNAQVTSSGIATSAPVADTEAQDGDVICTYTNGNRRCDKDYDPAMYGVISDNPAASVEDEELENSRLVVSSGVATVRITSINGNISEGDFLTSSESQGISQKATRNGYVLGMALEDYQSDNPDAVGRIQVMINIHPSGAFSGSRGNLLQFIREGLTVPIFEPIESLRYLLAIAIILISFTLGMIYFGRASRAGIEAIGRNPLAKRVIQFTVLLNISLTIIIILVGLAIAYLILIL